MRALAIDKITADRLIALPHNKLADGDRLLLLEHVPTLSLERLLDVLHLHGHLDRPARFVDALDRVLDVQQHKTNFLFLREGHKLAATLGEDAYADLVERLSSRVEAREKSDLCRAAIGHARGCGRFNGVASADPRLGLLLIGIRTDPKACLSGLAELASSSGEELVRVWKVVQQTKDTELEAALVPLVLRCWDFSWVGRLRDVPPWLCDLVGLVCDWALHPEQATPREEALWQRAIEAHARGLSWSEIEHAIPQTLSTLRRRAQRNALECGERTMAALAALKEDLSAALPVAWDRLMEWMKEFPGALPLWLLVRDSPLPGEVGEDFWPLFFDAWRSAARVQEEQISMQPKGPFPVRVAEKQLARSSGNLFPRMDDDSLFERIVSKNPSAASAVELVRILRETPRLLRDPRVLGFAGSGAMVALATSPDIESILREGEEAVACFRKLSGSAADEVLRAYLLGRVGTTEYWGFTLAEWSRSAWVTEIINDDLREAVRCALLKLPASDLLEASVSADGWVSREEVARVIREAPSLGVLLPKDLPTWLNGALAERLGTCPVDEVEPLVERLASAVERKLLPDILSRRALHDAAPEVTNALFGLLETRNAWEKYGHPVVGALLVGGRPEDLFPILSSASKGARPPLDEQQREPAEQGQRFLSAVHQAVAKGILQWIGSRVEAGDHEAAETGFIAIAHLDPPPPFTRELRTFCRRQGVSEAEKNWAIRLEEMAKQGKSEATLVALRYCLEELVDQPREDGPSA